MSLRASGLRRRWRSASSAIALAAVATLFSALPSPAAALEQKLVASDGAEYDYFGYSIAIDGDTLVVGAPRVSGDGLPGAVYVYQLIGDSWTQTARLTASDGAAGDRLGRSVAIDGDTIVAGAYRGDVGSNVNQGAVYTFARTGSATRTETAKLTASDGAADDNLGHSVAIDGDTIVAGAWTDNIGSNDDQGSVYTFASTGSATRTETAKLTATEGAENDWLGFSVAIDGDTIVAGAPHAVDDQGAVYTFAGTGASTRTETATLTASDGDGLREDELGFSVAIDGDTIAAGALVDPDASSPRSPRSPTRAPFTPSPAPALPPAPRPRS